MYKFFLFFFVVMFFISESGASNTKLIKGNSYEDQIKWKFVKFNLPKGKWIYYGKSSWDFYHFHGSCSYLISTYKKIIKGNFEICYVDSGGKLRGQFGALLQGELKNNKYGLCSKRSDFFYSKFRFKGASTNCFVSRYIDLENELNNPDDPSAITARLKKYIKENDLIIPKNSLQTESFYFSNRRDRAYSVSTVINPEFYGAPKSINSSGNESEYKQANIDKYPIKKKFMMMWTKEMTNEHKYLEKQMGASNEFALNFSDIPLIDNNNQNSDLVKQIKKLDQLYKSGVLTKDEFEKAKKKLLN